MQVVTRGDAPAGRRILYLFFSVFLVVGVAASIPLTFVPWGNHLASAKWERVPCRVVSAQVRRHPSGKGSDTYSIEVEFAYERDGTERRSTRYSFFEGSSSGEASKLERVREILADPSPECLVDPSDPDNAVFDRTLGATAFLSALPLVFVLIGGAGLLLALRASLRAPDPSRAAPPRTGRVPPPSPSRARDGYYDLSPVGHPVLLFLFLLFFSVAWNGMLGVALHAFVTGAFDDAWPLVGLFLVPFLLAGVGMLAFAVHTFLSLFNPRLRVAVSSERIEPGSEFSLRWSIDRPGALSRLALRLEKRETIESWDDGNTHHTSTRVLASLPVAQVERAGGAARGERRVTLPEEGEPVCAGDGRKVAWFLKVEGEIPRWPDLVAEFELPVPPARP